MGAFTGATIGWIDWGIMALGDAFGNSRFVDETILALGILGAYAAFNGRSRSCRIAVTVATVLCATFWLAVPDGWWVKPPPPPKSDGSAVPTADELREVERETHLTFPASMRILFWDAKRGKDPYFQIKFEMAAADWPSFIAGSPFRDQPPGVDPGAKLGGDYGA